MKKKTRSVSVQNSTVGIPTIVRIDCIGIADIARYRDLHYLDDDLIISRLRYRNTIEHFGRRARLENQNCKPVEFVSVRKQSGLKSFTLPRKQWIRCAKDMEQPDLLKKPNLGAIEQMQLTTENETTMQLEAGGKK